ncbi:MAG: YsnF/AvaK domain-containing protein [Gordonia sp. (in: high G+C Gram-positive bacteria)]|uniref:YsnF/AvaK domain-containing protein n=1 Tax=Gordonia sp. (in: high G+C Gram-positive bacteria) TaxID=84139 RepID=UPI0039E36460
MDVTQGAAENLGPAQPDKMTVGLHQEYLTAKTREVVTGIAQVRTSVVTESEELTVPVSREVVEVDRVAVDDREVDEMPTPYWDGDTLVVPVVEEEIVVVKKLVVREEVRITRQRKTKNVHVDGEVRRQRVDVVQVDPHHRVRAEIPIDPQTQTNTGNRSRTRNS